jgi:hypothetical protein
MSALAQLRVAQSQAVEAGMCRCLCGLPRAVSGDYFDWGRCRKRADRAKVAAEASDAGLPGRSSLSVAVVRKVASSHTPTGERPRDAKNRRKGPQRPRRPGGVTLSYGPVVALIERLIGDRQDAEVLVREIASPRQRERLEASQ